MPLIYTCDDKMLDNGLLGFYKNGKWCKGFKELVEDYKWYKTNNSWDYNKEIIENNGMRVLVYD